MDKEEYYKRIEKINNRFKTDRVSADEEYHLVCQKNYLSIKYIEHLEQQCKKQKEAIDKAMIELDTIINDLEKHGNEAPAPSKEELCKIFNILKEVSE